ncbi:MAG: hypothetical protein IKC26_11065 [Clostridia bacterium]|nr:hypothetical protein [Clostridia bacterium]MBR2908566.1 hypothetical protein [Clostridia bacterium]
MERKLMGKRIASLLLCLLMLSSAVTLFSSCGNKIKNLDPYREEFQRLIEQSFLVNEILFGEGLPVYARDECLGELNYSEEKNEEYLSYFRETVGKDLPEQLYSDKADKFRMYYWLYKDTSLSQISGEEIYVCKYSTTYYLPEGENEEGEYEYDMVTEISYALKRRNAEESIPEALLSGEIEYKDDDGEITSVLKVSEDVLYTTEEGVCYYALEGYEEPVFEYEYDEKDNEHYDVVRLDAKYLTIDAIKELAEEVYSAEYLKSVYSSLFDGIRTDFSDSSSSVLLARYIEEASGDDGLVYLRKSNISEALFEEHRTYDYGSMTIRKPYNKNRVNVNITAYGTYYSTETKQVENGAHTVRLSFVLENGVWRLDSPTY